ncbi:MBL fold metallo-hydrolase [Neobacillus terrae]|uniref:MBL fold metallo-hydrolase n=1 Tax=Neobacillus terrae TaxID=3034837 RepID=UPI001408FEB4|nr:MBL fold metallo-hydrolase [Neobacillus terrae]NHM31533.1 MBL fold metallo-hydrolase [Neobacillus terrae]
MDKQLDNKFEDSFLPMTSLGSGLGISVLPDIFCYTNKIVNLCFVGDPEKQEGFFLIDAGMPKNADEIMEAAAERYGKGKAPKAIILTHGHFDHVGSLVELLDHWNVPVYAHSLEMPYLTGKANYPPGDSTIDEGLVGEMSPLFPNHGIDLGEKVQALPEDGSIPGMTGWKWIHTPGHSSGHISLFRESDRALIAGDAFVTVKQESLYKVLTQKKEISGPPKYFTPDWRSAYESVEKLKSLNPSVAATGHGQPMAGEELSEALNYLVNNWSEIGLPEHGKYLD